MATRFDLAFCKIGTGENGVHLNLLLVASIGRGKAHFQAFDARQPIESRAV